MKAALQVMARALGYQLEERIKKMGYALIDLQRFSNALGSQDNQLVSRIPQNSWAGDWNVWSSLPSSKLQSSCDANQVGSRWHPTMHVEEEKCAGWDCVKPQSVCGLGRDLDVWKNSNVQSKTEHGHSKEKMKINSKACNGLNGCDAMEE